MIPPATIIPPSTIPPDSQAQDIIPPTRNRPRVDAKVAFLARHLVSQFVDHLLPGCHIPGCAMTPRVEYVRELQQLWSIRISCGHANHGWTFITGEMEEMRGTPIVTSNLYHSTLCAGLTHTSLSSVCTQLGLYVPTSSHWYDFQTGAGRPGVGWIQAVKDQWSQNKQVLWQELQAFLQAERLREESSMYTSLYVLTLVTSSYIRVLHIIVYVCICYYM